MYFTKNFADANLAITILKIKTLQKFGVTEVRVIIGRTSLLLIMSKRSWVFTINNYSEETIQVIKALPCLRIICGKEVAPSTGTPHLQGAIVFPKPMRLNAVKTALGGTAHLEPMKGRWSDQSYCAKEGNLVRMEDHSQQGDRTDLVGFREAIKRKAPDNELIENHLEVLAKYPRLEGRLKMHYLKASTREFRKVEVIVHWGEGGTGKTRAPYEEGAFMFDDYEDGWWDGYDGESVILLDDFYGGIKWSFFLRLLDGYQCRLKIKYGHTYAQWSKVYITSNKHPNDWYRDHDLSEIPFKRRIHKIVHFPGDVKC